jgi:glycosyltransferase involved in cell wall biosynthesis
MQTVSVVIPTWNRASTIGAAVRSVLSQTHPVHEILVCDDGSTDNTREILTGFEDSRIRLIEGPRAGRPAIPRNRGIREAKGEWLAFLDSDDEWMPNKLEMQFKDLERAGLKASCTNALRVVPGINKHTKYLNTFYRRFNLNVLLQTNFVICSSVLVQKELVEQAGGFPEEEALRAVEDYALWLRLCTLSDFVYHHEPLTLYTDDTNNSIRVGANELVQRENVMRSLYEWYGRQESTANQDAIRTAYKTAMKKNGRSFWERLKVK